MAGRIDLSSLSTEDLEALVSGRAKTADIVKKLPTEQLEKLVASEPAAQAQEQPSIASRIGSGALRAVQKGVEVYDAFGGGASMRSAEMAALEGRSPLKAAVSQYGKDPSKAPTGKDIAVRLGADQQPFVRPDQVDDLDMYQDPMAYNFRKVLADTGVSPAGVAGFGIDMASDPLMIAGGPLKMVGKGLIGAVEAARGTQLGGKIIGGAERLGKAAVAKAGATFSGATEREILTYIERGPELIKDYKAAGEDISLMADQARERIQASITSKRRALGQQIGDAMATATEKRTMSAKPILDSLQSSRARLNPITQADEVAQVDELIQTIGSLADKKGRISPKDLFDAKDFLQDRAKGAYFKSGQMFQPGSKAQNAARQAGAEAKRLFDGVAPEQIKSANKQLESLHRLDDEINRNLIAKGKSDAAFRAAGSGENPRGARQLEQIGKITGTSPLLDAQNIAAAKRFGNPSLTAAEGTGKTVERKLVGGLAGYVVGGPVGAAVGAALTSPAAVKAAIDTGRLSKKAVMALLNVNVLDNKALTAAVAALQTARGQKFVQDYMAKERGQQAAPEKK